MIELEDVTVRYSSRSAALHNISLRLETFPLVVLGPNGAGKSTLLSLIAGIRRPTTGRVALSDYDRRSSRGSSLARLRAHTGWLPQEVAPIAGFTCAEQVAYAGWLKGMRVKAARAAAADVLDEVGLGPLSGRRAHELSGGERRRLGIAQALVHTPEFVILDEPHAGLDPEQRVTIRRVLDQISLTTRIIVSTHQTDDLAETYRSVLVLTDGRVIAHCPVTDFFSIAKADGVRPRAEDAYLQLLQRARTSA